MSARASDYVWSGSTSTSWATASNWLPATGVPGSGDNVTIVSGTNQPLISASVTVTNFTMSSGTLSFVSGQGLSVTGSISITGGTINANSGSVITFSGAVSFTGGTYNSGSSQVPLTIGSSSTSVSSVILGTSSSGPTIGRAIIYTNSLQMMNTTLGNSLTTSSIKVTNSTAITANIGGNQLNKVTIEAAGTADLRLSTSAASTYNKAAVFINSGSGNLYTSYAFPDTYIMATASDEVTSFQNTGSGYIYANYKGVHNMDRNIELTSTGSSQGIFFGNGTGVTNLLTTRMLSIINFSIGTLELKNVIQPTGVTTAQTINLSGSAILRYTSSIFNGAVTSSAPGIEFNGATFNGTTSLTKTGSGLSSSISSSSYTYFYGTTTITNAGSGELQLGGSSFFGFSYKGDVTFNKTGTGALNAAYSGYVYFYGNLTVLNNSFGTGTAYVGFPGAADQYILGTITAYNLIISKYTCDVINSNTTELITVTNLLSFTGIRSRIKALHAPLVLGNNSVVNGVSTNNYVIGNLQKIGNQAFTFPVGAGTSYTYMPISISAPALATDAFTVSYADGTAGGTLASPLKTQAPGYWTINRITGSSNIQAILSWNSNTPKPIFPDAAHVAILNAGFWQDGGASNLTYGYLQGSVASASLTASSNTLSLAFTSANPDACSTTDATMNWISVRSFDEYGRVINDQRVFADNLGRAKQTQQRNLVENVILAKSTVYDTYGRAALATLPAPIADVTCFAYNANFITNNSGAEYSRKDFDSTKGGASITLNSPNLVSSTSPLGKYYSNSNTYEAYVATSSYPYKTIDYNDFVIEGVTRSSDAAEDLRMGNGHEQRSITLPVFGELNNYYAVKNANFVASGGASLDGEVLKTVTKDENGTEQITYTNKSGQTIAQCVASTTESQNISVNIYAQASICNLVVSGTYTYKNVQIHNAGPVNIYDNDLVVTWTGTAANHPYTLLEGPRSLQVNCNSPFYITYDVYLYDVFGSTIFVTKGRVESTNTSLLQNSTDVHLQANHNLSFTNYSANGNIKVTNLETGAAVYTGAASDFTLASSLAPGFYRIQYTTQTGAYVNASGAYITISYVNRYGNYTYSFYDNVGRLIAQTAPNGVNRASNGLPKFTSTYIYNTLGWLLFSSDPDRDGTYYVYQKDGKLRFSQDAIQRAGNRFSYVNYDNIKRTTETGEYTSGAASGSPTALYFMNMLSDYVGASIPSGYASIYTVLENTDGIDDARCSTVSKESYDKPVTLPSGLSSTYTQHNVNGKVSTSSNNNLTSWYSYDELGRLEWTMQQFAGTTSGTAGGDFSSVAANRVKTIDYQYDLLGNLLQVNYQKNTTAERLDHFYTYDVMRRLKKVETSLSGGALVEHAEYQYYLHGPLKRKELGNDLQGLDYVYTIGGKLKAINHPYLDANDPGADSYTGAHSAFSKDVFGMMLEYYDNDYVRDSKYQTTSNLTSLGYTNYYNGIVRSSTWKLSSLAQYVYTYDAKYQLTGATFGSHSTSTNEFFAAASNQYNVYGITYDLNGNLKTLRRYDATGITTSKDYIDYVYTANTNRLQKTQNSLPADTRTYTYDVIGRMMSYSNTTIGSNQYTLYDYTGKVTAVYKDAGYTQPLESFLYDEKGYRIRKTEYNATSPYAAVIHTWYINDASGDVMSIYITSVATATTSQNEILIYGNDRIGNVYKKGTTEYYYEIKDQLGNTRAVIRRNPTTFVAEVLDWRDYDPHGNLIRGLVGSQNNRYACYQGEYAERDDETGFINFDLRMYDPAIGRWMIPDPMDQNFSPYLAMGNNPLSNTDPTGGEYYYASFGYYGGYGGGYGGGWSQSGGNVAYFQAGGGGYSSYTYTSTSYSFSIRGGRSYGGSQGNGTGDVVCPNFNDGGGRSFSGGSNISVYYGSSSSTFAMSGAYISSGSGEQSMRANSNSWSDVAERTNNRQTNSNKTVSSNRTQQQQQQRVVIDNTEEAWDHYKNGKGKDAYIGPNTIQAVLNNKDFLAKKERIISGLTTAMKGNFGVDMTFTVFHIGDTRVNYSINCASGNCSATFTLFAGDGFWDVDLLDEFASNMLGLPDLGIKKYTPDGLGPNLERFEGTPYKYVPANIIISFPNPGYK